MKRSIALAAALLSCACAASSSGSDAGEPCAIEGQYSCVGGGRICCGGRIRTFSDGLCGGPPHDSGMNDAGPSCAELPIQPGCPCTGSGDAGTAACPGAIVLACASGVWTPTDVTCDYCTFFGP